MYLRKTIIPAMKRCDQLFDVLFKDIYYGGSYYDGLKIGKPNEYDLNFVMDSNLIFDGHFRRKNILIDLKFSNEHFDVLITYRAHFFLF